MHLCIFIFIIYLHCSAFRLEMNEKWKKIASKSGAKIKIKKNTRINKFNIKIRFQVDAKVNIQSIGNANCMRVNNLNVCI